MNKFTTMLAASHKSIKESRARLISEDTADAQEDLVRRLKKDGRDIEREIMKLEDLAPDSTLSLNPTKDSYDADEWVKQMQDAKIKQLNIKIQLKLAIETSTSWFNDDEEDDN